MTRAGALVALGLALLAWAPARAQAPASPSADPIDALLRLRQASPATPLPDDEPDTAAGGGRTDPDPVVPSARVAPAPRPAVTLTAPVRLEDTGRSPDGPPSPADLAYDGRIRASMASAQSFLGPLDGGWTLMAGPKALFVLQLSDRNGVVEGAWRDPERPGQPGASGLIDDIAREGDDLRLSFAGVTGVLHAGADGRWAGEIVEAGRPRPVRLVRRNP